MQLNSKTDMTSQEDNDKQMGTEYIMNSLHSIFNNKLKDILKQISDEHSINYDDLETRYIQTNTLDLTVPIHKKKKRKKNTVLNQTELCMARKADTGQCTRRRKDGSDFCGKHNGQLKFGRIDDTVLSKDKQNFIQCSSIKIEGTDYLIDKHKVVYSYDIDHPTILGYLDENSSLILA